MFSNCFEITVELSCCKYPNVTELKTVKHLIYLDYKLFILYEYHQLWPDVAICRHFGNFQSALVTFSSKNRQKLMLWCICFGVWNFFFYCGDKFGDFCQNVGDFLVWTPGHSEYHAPHEIMLHNYCYRIRFETYIDGSCSIDHLSCSLVIPIK